MSTFTLIQVLISYTDNFFTNVKALLSAMGNFGSVIMLTTFGIMLMIGFSGWLIHRL